MEAQRRLVAPGGDAASGRDPPEPARRPCAYIHVVVEGFAEALHPQRRPVGWETLKVASVEEVGAAILQER